MTIEKKIYLDAVNKTEGDRPKFVDAVCGASGELRDSVESLIEAHEEQTGQCGGQTISVVLDRHQRDLLSDRTDRVIPPAQDLAEPED
jgi:hypothetical protein